MKKLLEKWKGIVTLVLVSLSLYSCKDDDNSGISTESIIGVWEGIKADSWSIVPAAEATEGWWGQRPDKDSQYGTDISDYRVECSIAFILIMNIQINGAEVLLANGVYQGIR